MKNIYFDRNELSGSIPINLFQNTPEMEFISFDLYDVGHFERTEKNKASWEVVGEMVDKFKRFVHREITFDGHPMIGMITSLQDLCGG